MNVSYEWLREYVPVVGTPDELALRLTMAGLTIEHWERVGSDVVFDVEVTSNRADCLGHAGIAREFAAIYDLTAKVPDPQPNAAGKPAASSVSVTIEDKNLCPRYQARVIRGVKVGPSPAKLVHRLSAVFDAFKPPERKSFRPVNNVVDITNFVLMETGQPLHAFDLAKLAGPKIVVRRAKAGEKLLAINHREYDLDASMVVIADAEKPVALAGVMGGAATEVTESTVDLLIESAQFSPLAVRHASRKLALASDSSYRFERGVDPEGIDRASRRCCELILEHAGGELAEGDVFAGDPPPPRVIVPLRWNQIERILGIHIPHEEAVRILTKLGCVEKKRSVERIEFETPSWRRDLTREIDLVEEVARVHGYDNVPEDARVPMTASHKTRRDRVLDRIRRTMTGTGHFEAMTRSLVDEKSCQLFSPWTNEPPHRSLTPMMGSDCARTSLLPSLLDSVRTNEKAQNPEIRLFEIAKIYLPTAGGLPTEPTALGVATTGDFYELKGTLEALLETLNPALSWELTPSKHAFFASDRQVELSLSGKRVAVFGQLSKQAMDAVDLRNPVCMAEVLLEPLVEIAELVPTTTTVSPYPTIQRDLNLIVDEAKLWAEIEAIVRSADATLVERAIFREIYRNPKQDGPGKKRMLFSIELRAPDRTLTGDEADAVCRTIVDRCGERLGAKLLA